MALVACFSKTWDNCDAAEGLLLTGDGAKKGFVEARYEVQSFRTYILGKI